MKIKKMLNIKKSFVLGKDLLVPIKNNAKLRFTFLAT